MHLFLMKRKGRDSDGPALACLKEYAAKEGICLDGARIERSEAGKPRIADSFGVNFSISHTGDIWACLAAGCEVGLDLQVETEIDAMRIAKRFFTDDEQEYIKEHGRAGFFDVWVRKEAAAKCIGGSLMNVIGSLKTADAGGLLEETGCKGRPLKIRGVDLGSEYAGVRCAVCAADEDGRDTDISKIELWTY